MPGRTPPTLFLRESNFGQPMPNEQREEVLHRAWIFRLVSRTIQKKEEAIEKSRLLDEFNFYDQYCDEKIAFELEISNHQLNPYRSPGHLTFPSYKEVTEIIKLECLRQAELFYKPVLMIEPKRHDEANPDSPIVGWQIDVIDEICRDKYNVSTERSRNSNEGEDEEENLKKKKGKIKRRRWKALAEQIVDTLQSIAYILQ